MNWFQKYIRMNALKLFYSGMKYKKTLIFSIGAFIIVTVSVCLYGNNFLLKQNESHQNNLPPATASALREAKEFWKLQIKAIGPEKAYTDFLARAANDTLPPHEQAHAFGEALYNEEGLSGLGYCDSSFEFGCYHSFFGVAVAEKGIGVLPEFRDACQAKFGDYNLPCEHGIGHGVLVYTDYENLEEALRLCESISTLPTGGCSSGVFMEYNFHTMDESTQGFLREKNANLYEPCVGLAEKFQPSCYVEQVQWWQNLFNNDFKYIGVLCSQLVGTKESQEACFHGIGNYLAASVDLSVEKIIAGCTAMPNVEEQTLCHEGASWLVRGDGSEIKNAEKICSALPEIYAFECLKKLQY